MLKSLLPEYVKVNFTIDDIRLRSNLTTNEKYSFTKKSFFFTKIGFTQSHSGPLGDVERFVQLIPASYRSHKPIKISGVDKVHVECDCIDGSVVVGSIVDGSRETISYSFGPSSPPSHKIHNVP